MSIPINNKRILTNYTDPELEVGGRSPPWARREGVEGVENHLITSH